MSVAALLLAKPVEDLTPDQYLYCELKKRHLLSDNRMQADYSHRFNLLENQ